MNYNNFYSLSKCAIQYAHQKIRASAVSNTEHAICVLLKAHNNKSQDEISDSLRLEKSTVARAISSLEEKGFIAKEQNPTNKRKNIISITKSGIKSIKDISDIYQMWFSEISSCLSKEEQKNFSKYLERLLEKAIEINNNV